MMQTTPPPQGIQVSMGFDPLVSWFPNSWENLPERDIPASEFVKAIKDGKSRNPIKEIRDRFAKAMERTGGNRQDSKKVVATHKKKLCAVTFSGVFATRQATKLTAHSGLLQADIDLLGDTLPAIREKLQADPHVWALFVSATGDGLKALYRVPPCVDDTQHGVSHASVAAHVKQLCGVDMDNTSDVNRLCYTSHDPDAYLNPDAVELPMLDVPEPQPEVVETKPVRVNAGVNLTERERIMQEILGTIKWESATTGFCECPGKSQHTNGDGAKDCKVFIDGAPSIKCMHTSCEGAVAAVNRELRSRIGAAEHPARTSSNGALQVEPPSYSEFETANLLEQRLPPLKTFGQDWYVYDAGAWNKMDRATLRPQALATIPTNWRTARRERELLTHLESRKQGTPGSMFGFYKAEPDGAVLLNVANGVLRVAKDKQPELLEHSAKHGFTAKTVASFDPMAPADLFENTLIQILPDQKDRELLQMFAGYCLLPDCRYEAALVCYGEAGTGKSTVAELIGAAIGPGLVQRLSMSQICDPKSYHLPNLRFAAVNLGTELDAVEMDESANFKVIVSGEQVEARPIYGEPFTMRTAAKLWFLANGLPRFKHGTEAELRRTRFIRFGYMPEKRDVTLKARLLTELDGVFLWMVLGLGQLLLKPAIPIGSDESAKVHERFKVTNDPLGAFVATRCDVSPNNIISKAALGEAYDVFCEDYGLSIGLSPIFYKMLYDRFTGLKDSQTRDAAGKRVRSVRGLCLKSEVNNE